MSKNFYGLGQGKVIFVHKWLIAIYNQRFKKWKNKENDTWFMIIGDTVESWLISDILWFCSGGAKWYM